MASFSADLISRAWRRVDIKLNVDGEIHVLRWRRGWIVDEVLFDDRRVATSTGIFGRETIYGLSVKNTDDRESRLLLTIDPEAAWNDWTDTGRPRGVRLETADEALIAFGSLGPDRAEPFRQLYDQAINALGLSAR